MTAPNADPIDQALQHLTQAAALLHQHQTRQQVDRDDAVVRAAQPEAATPEDANQATAVTVAGDRSITEYLTAEQAAKRYPIGINSLRELMREGTITHICIGPRARMLVHPLDIEAWFAAQERPAALDGAATPATEITHHEEG